MKNQLKRMDPNVFLWKSLIGEDMSCFCNVDLRKPFVESLISLSVDRYSRTSVTIFSICKNGTTVVYFGQLYTPLFTFCPPFISEQESCVLRERGRSEI